MSTMPRHRFAPSLRSVLAMAGGWGGVLVRVRRHLDDPISVGGRQGCCGAHQARTSTGIYRCPVRLVRVPSEGVGAAWCRAGAAVVRLVRITIFTLGAGLVRG